VTWAKYSERVSGREAWSQWWDEAAARAWFAQALRLARSIATKDGRGYAEQLAFTRALFLAVANAYRSIDTPPASDPAFRASVRKWFARLDNTDPTSRGRNPVEGKFGPSEAGGVHATRGEFAERIRRLWVRWGKAPIDAQNTLEGIIVRINLNEDARVLEQCIDAYGGEGGGLCDFRGLYMGAGQDDAPREGTSNYDWRTFCWNDPPGLWGAADFVPRVNKALPPLRWHAEFAAELAEQLASRGPVEVIRQARSYQVAANLRVAEALGILPAELLRRSTSLPADVEGARWDNPGMKAGAAAIALVAAAAQTVPVVGQVAGAVLGVIAAIAAVLPGAVAIEVDELGRGKPVFERSRIRGRTPDLPPEDTMDRPDATDGSPNQLAQTAQLARLRAQVGTAPMVPLGFQSIAPTIDQGATYNTTTNAPQTQRSQQSAPMSTTTKVVIVVGVGGLIWAAAKYL
jgi:hypothetical protein